MKTGNVAGASTTTSRPREADPEAIAIAMALQAKLIRAFATAVDGYIGTGGQRGDTVEVVLVVSDTCGQLGAASMTGIQL